MNNHPWQHIVNGAVGAGGVRGALIVSADDGLVIAESAMVGLETADVAALAASLVQRALRVTRVANDSPPTSVRLSAEGGTLIAVAGAQPLWLVAIAEPSAELGRLRLLLGDLASTLS